MRRGRYEGSRPTAVIGIAPIADGVHGQGPLPRSGLVAGQEHDLARLGPQGVRGRQVDAVAVKVEAVNGDHHQIAFAMDRSAAHLSILRPAPGREHRVPNVHAGVVLFAAHQQAHMTAGR